MPSPTSPSSPSDTMTIKEVDITRPLDQFIAAQVGSITSKAASDRMMRNELNRKTALLAEVAVEIDGLLGDEDLMNAIDIERHERLMNLLWRVRKAY